MTHSRSPSPTRWGGVTVTSFHCISNHDVGWHSISWPFPPAFHHSHPTWGESDTPTHWLWEIDWLTCSLMWWVWEIRHSSLRTPERKSVVARVSIVDDLVEVWTLWPSYELRVKWVNPVCGCHWPCKLGNQIVWFANAHASGVITAGPGFLRANKETRFRWAHTRPGTLSRNSYSMSKIDWRTLDEQVPWTSCMPKWYAQRPGFMGSTLASDRVFWIDDQSVSALFLWYEIIKLDRNSVCPGNFDDVWARGHSIFSCRIGDYSRNFRNTRCKNVLDTCTCNDKYKSLEIL